MIIKVDPNESSRIFAGGKDMWVSDNSGSSWDQISDWTLMYSGGGDEYLHCDHHTIEFKPGSSTVFITSFDGGVFYTTNATNNHPDFQEKNQRYNTLQFYTCDPADYDSKINVLYANAVDFFGGSQNKLLRIEGIPDNPLGEYLSLPTGRSAYFSHVKVSPRSPLGTTVLFLGTQTGRVFRVENAQETPIVTEIASDYFPTASVSCIAAGDTEEKLLVTFPNYGVESVWLTLDEGLTWTNMEGNLPDIPVRWAIIHPDNEDQALVATELGVWSTSLLTTTEVVWEQEIEGLANVRVDMLKLRTEDNTVLAATHGRGFFYGLLSC